MSVKLPNGSILSLATTYGSAKTISAVTNANPAVATSTSHGFSNGDIVEITSGWTKVNSRIYRVANVATNSFEIEGLDTTSTTLYPAGTGIGSAREITALTQITQILGMTTNGGDMQFTTYSFLESDAENQLPTQASAQSIQLDIADDPSLAGYIALKAAAGGRALTGLKLLLPDNSFLLYNGYVSFNETPSLTKGQVMAVKSTFSLQGAPVRYAS